ncbi:MAG: chemotaxis-specific protein-glutamate methyltransferase CheB [Chlamydiota bacterium]
MSTSKVQVLIVEDSPSVQLLLKKIITEDPHMNVCGVVSDGKEAVEFIQRNSPDVITMDIMMPKMNGIDATKMIMMENPTPIVVISAKYSKEDVKTGFEAIEAGAVSILEKPPGMKDPSFQMIAANIRKTVRSVAGIKVMTRRPHLMKDREAPKLFPRASRIEAIAIGCSLGGPQALQNVLENLPDSFPIPIFVVQHIADGFGEGFIEWMDKSVPLNVITPSEGEAPKGGYVYIAPDDKHMIVTKQQKISIVDSAPVSGLKPSVSLLFSSFSQSYGENALGILLTGMGADGSKELLSMHQQGAVTIAQNEETCIAYGMPGSAVKIGAVKHILSLDEISDYLLSLGK